MRQLVFDVKKMELRNYQTNAIENIRNVFKSGKKKVMLVAPTGCLTGDITIGVNRAKKGYQIRLDQLVHKFNGGNTMGPKWNMEIPTMVRARLSFGDIGLVQVMSAYNSGKKRVYSIVLESGNTIKATLEHRILTEEGWKSIRKISISDYVYIEESRRPLKSKQKKKKKHYFVNVVKLHPYVRRRGVKPGKGGFTVSRHRLVFEASMNSLSFKQYIHKLNNDIDGLVFLNPEMCVHHIDENHKNNELSNLMACTKTEHNKLHEDSINSNIQVRSVLSKVVSMEYIGIESTYDLSMAHPNNYIANGIVVHNSGKTIIACNIIEEAVRKSKCVLFIAHRKEIIYQTSQKLKDIDVEHGLILSGHKPSLMADIHVASIQTLIRRDPPPADLLILDECFPAGTLVDGAPIEDYAVGNEIMSFNHNTDTVESRRITRIYKKQERNLLLNLQYGATELACTANHPFFVRGKRYVEAKDLNVGDMFCVRRNISEDNAEWVRLDSIKSIKQTGDEGVTVYNFEVEKNNNYFANGVLVHNCHHLKSKSYKKIIDHYPNAYILGLTATPCRGDGQGLGSEFDELIQASQVKELIDQNYLVPIECYAPSKPDLKGLHIRMGDYKTDELEKAVDKPKLIGDIIDHWHQYASDRQTIVFCVLVAHSQHMTEAFIQSGVKAAHLDGETPKEKRMEILKDLENGKLQVVCNVGVLTEGYDNPIVSCIVLARPTKSKGLFLQMAGRGLRPALGKENLLLLDHSGAIYEHGMIDQEIDWTLEPGKLAYKEKKPEKKQAKDWICTHCYFINKPSRDRHCGNCGLVPINLKQPAVKPGKLQKVDKVNYKNLLLLDKEKLWNKCFWQANKLGLKVGAAAHMYKKKTGVWPRGFDLMPKVKSHWQMLARDYYEKIVKATT